MKKSFANYADKYNFSKQNCWRSFRRFYHHTFSPCMSINLDKTDNTTLPPQQPEQSSVMQEFRALLERSLELELVISGAVTLSLLQLPSWLDAVQTNILVQYGRSLVLVLILISLVKPIAYSLTGALVLHLVLRSFWIGMIGVHSVYPDSKKEPVGGNFYRRFIATRTRGLKEQAATVDKFCRIIFGYSFSMITLFLGVIVLIIISSVLGYGVQRLLFPKANVLIIILYFYIALFLPYFVAIIVDYAITYIPFLRRFGENTLLQNYCFRMLRVYGMVFGSAAVSVLTTLSANAPRLYYSAFAVGMILFMSSTVVQGTLTWRTHPYFPDDGAEAGIEYVYYENMAEAGNLNRVHIQSDIIQDKYLRLFLGFNTRYTDSLAKYYPDVQPLYADGLDNSVKDNVFPKERLNACMRAIASSFVITLNGRSIAADSISFENTRFRFYTYPKNKQKGIMGYIPSDSLLRGENMLIVRDRFDTTVVRYIPFWY